MSLIIGKNFTIPDLPDVPDSLPLFRVTQARALARGDAAVRREFEARIERWAGAFAVEAEPADLGDRVLYLSDDAALEVYLPSDSLWWSDRVAAFSEQPPDEPLPGPEEATDLAWKQLGELDVNDDGLVLRGVTTINAASVASPEDTPELVPTGVTVGFGYMLDDLPVVGPGARIRVGYSGGGRLAEFARFWRPPAPGPKARTLHPMQAIERLANDERFAGVEAGGLEVELTELTLGFYAAGPSTFQRFLVPVYEARGRVVGGELGDEDGFDVYVAAVETDAVELKRSSVRDRAVFRRVFTGF